jgi:hypothetical protein
MDILELREYCLALPLAEETTPFDEMTLVYKVAGKMFLLTDMAIFAGSTSNAIRTVRSSCGTVMRR